ncbi:MAG TPA: TRAP transporter TatT component family protein [Pyrinomonadaceae bacterium]|nr:TRAP transporter TatT component family protein [Pyrinomonadaceae bacterium]
MLSRSLSLLAIMALVVGAISCQSHSRVESPMLDRASIVSNITQADQFYKQRDDLARLQQGIVLLRQAVASDSGNFDAQWRLAKFDYYLGSHTEGDHRDQAFREGVEAGKAAIKLQQEKPEGHFWLGANYGGSLQAETISGLASTTDVREQMQTVLKLNEGYQDGSAYMVLGLLDLKTPRIAGGDPERAVNEMEKGLQFGQANAFLHLHLAEAYQAVGRAADAQRQLNAILSMTPDPDYLPELREAQAQAREMLARAELKFPSAPSGRLPNLRALF